MQKKIIVDVQDRIKEILTPEDFVASCIDRNDLERERVNVMVIAILN